ncbi:hypothetical protein [Streptomyces sp. NPDC004050]
MGRPIHRPRDAIPAAVPARESVTLRWSSAYYTALSRPTRAESED